MDRLSQLRGEAGGSRDSTLDTTSPPSEAFMTANESSSKYYSLSEVDSTFDISSIKDDISSIKDVSLASTAAPSEGTITNADELISNLSPIGKKSDILDSYKIDTQIEAANILSGGVAIFDDNDNSYDGHELVIDDNVVVDEKSNSELKQSEGIQFKPEENILESSLISEGADIASKDTEVMLQIDGTSVDAISIGNGLYLYRKQGQEELAAVQICDDQQQPNFKFLKVRENAEGNLEVYEEIEIEIPKEVPVKEGKVADKNISSHVPIIDINKVISDATSNKVAERKIITPRIETILTTTEDETENKEISPDKAEVNVNGKMMKFSESRKSPVIGSFTPMTYHSTPNKEGKPLTKTMVDQQLHTNRHSDLSNVKKTIEVHTDSGKQKTVESSPKNKDEDNKLNETTDIQKVAVTTESTAKDVIVSEDKNAVISDLKECNDLNTDSTKSAVSNVDEKIVDDIIIVKDVLETKNESQFVQDIVVIDSSEKVIEQTPENILQIDGLNKETENSIIIDKEKPEGKIEVNKVEESRILEKENNKITDAPVEIVNQVEEPEENKDAPMEIDDDTELIIAETIPYNEEKKDIDESSNQNEQKDDKQVTDTIMDKQEDTLTVIDEPILIDDDDVSIVEEVIVETKDETPKVEDASCNAKNDPKFDDNNKNVAETLEILSKTNEDSKKYDKEITQDSNHKDKVKQLADLPSGHSAIQPNSKKGFTPAVAEDRQEINVGNSVIETETKNNNTSLSLPVQNEAINDHVKSVASANILNTNPHTKVLQKYPKEDIVKPPSIALKPLYQPLVSTDECDRKPIESSTIKDVMPVESVKHVIPSNISPLLDKKPQSLVVPKLSQEKPVVEDKLNVKKPLPSVQNVNATAEHKIDCKILPTSLRKEPVTQTKSTESVPILAKIRKESKNPPVTVAQVVDKTMREVGNVLDIQKKVLPQPIKNITIDKHQLILDSKHLSTSNKDDIKVTKSVLKDAMSEKGKGVINLEITKVPKLDPAKTNIVTKQDVTSSSAGKTNIQVVKNKIDPKDNRELPRVVEAKPINNNHAAVPFGKWTEANRQEFLNKFKTKTSVTSSNSNQLKNSNDLNRRDVLKKIDSQRQSSNALSKTQEATKLSMKPETTAFSNKPNIINKETTQETKIPQKTEVVEVKPKPETSKSTAKDEVAPKVQQEQSQVTFGTNVATKEISQRTGVVQNLIDKTIEGMIHRSVSATKTQDEPKQDTTKEPSASKVSKPQPKYPIEQATLDAIEMKMNELHGIPFIERPAHELPIYKTISKKRSKLEKVKPVSSKTKIPNLLPYPNKPQQKVVKETVIEVDSEDEIIEHEPITGDIVSNKKSQIVKPSAKEKISSEIVPQKLQEKPVSDSSKKDLEKEKVITEKDFDKFARRNSITYENYLTVNFDGKESHNVVQTVVEKDICPKSYSRNDASRIDSKTKLPHKYQNVRPNTQPEKVNSLNKFAPAQSLGNDDASNRNQSKLQKAYHSALTAKRQMTVECPITIIEDKPVKVVFMDNNEYVPTQLNVQGQDLSPAKRAMPESDVTVSTCDSLDSDILDSIEDSKSQDDTKIKTKHQRKQVLTPVDEPEIELIEPSDLGIEVSPKKKRKTDDDKTDKSLKYPMRKKFYMLGSSSVTEEKTSNPVEAMKNPLKETVNLSDNGVSHKNPVSALDSLVKAAELIETQTENMNTSIVSNPDNQLTTPVKRGRGRPRKYPLTPEGTVDKNKVTTPSPQKKPRLIDAIVPKRDDLSDDSDSEEGIIKENWTMGKINENIVCPICNKLFRTENVVFKHVKHCTGPSPSRSDSDKRSPRRIRISQDFDTKSRDSMSDDMDIDDDKPLVIRKETPKKRKSKDSITKSDDKDDIIVIEDTPIKEKPEKIDDRKHHESRKPKTKMPPKSNSLVCEFCGKTFRQLSYLVSHKLQHKRQEKTEQKKAERDPPVVNKVTYSCETCKKEFRKLHHLVQHRIIHNPSSVPVRSLRKSSSEQVESKIDKEPTTSKQTDDPSAGFRCEPCDKSFRKLHHLVEHRETHDGINRQKTTILPPTKEEKTVEKPAMLHQCDICKKTFKKLQHLHEHKEQHIETSSEKSDDKSVQSSLSTRDIIHECSLCYMVFPNEHSLTKHTIICQRKKRQSKQLKPSDETEGGDEITESPPPEEKVEGTDSPKPIFETTTREHKDEDKQAIEEKVELVKDIPVPKELEEPKEKPEEPVKVQEIEKNTHKVETKVSEQVPPAKRDFVESETAKTEAISEVPEKIKKVEVKEPIKINETFKKKTPLKDKTTTKRVKTAATLPPKPATKDVKPAVESSDDDEVRYMLNPNFKAEDVTEEKVFMKVRAKKRSSLQIERPNSKDLVKRRTSLQHPPKIPRLKAKVVETNTVTFKKETKTPKLEPVPSTDSDDSETTKYSFPSTIPDKPIKAAQDRTPKDSERKIQKKPLVDKRKSLSGIAKRKSLGKAVTARHKASPIKQIKKRTLDAEHRCDCGQLFSSAALLSRHTTLAHTPPRIRRRRSPPPEEKPSVSTIKPAPRKSNAPEKSKQSPALRKSSARSDSSTSTSTKPPKRDLKPGRKSAVKDAESPSDSRKVKPEKSESKSSVKPRRTGAHRGVPVPDKMKKLMQKK